MGTPSQIREGFFPCFIQVLKKTEYVFVDKAIPSIIVNAPKKPFKSSSDWTSKTLLGTLAYM